jgi:outer membrane receptor protein involved in Fe transport
MRIRFGLWSISLLALGVASAASAQNLPRSGSPAAYASAAVEDPAGRVSGRVIDEYNAIPLPGVPVEVVGLDRVVHTDLDGKYLLELNPGAYQIRIELSGYQTRTIPVDVKSGAVLALDISLGLARFSEEVTVQADAITVQTSTAEAALLERMRAGAVSDNLPAQEMKLNGDGNAAAGLQRVTGLSVVDNQYVFVRGLGERYSNTTLGGSTIPSTEPEKKVVSLDMFPSGLLDSVSVVKSYTPDRPADFAGGLVEVVPLRIPSRPLVDLSYDIGGNSQSWSQDVMDHPGGSTDWLGIGDGSRDLPDTFPTKRVIRGGIYTPDIGLLKSELEAIGKASLPTDWSAQDATGKPYQGFSAVLGQRWGKLGVLASVSQSYKSTYQEEVQNYYRVEGDALTPFSEYAYNEAAMKGSLAASASIAFQASPNHRLGAQYFGTNMGRRETRTFEGPNADAGRDLRNTRLLWREENLSATQVTGEHFLPAMSNSRIDWRASYAITNRDEPDIRETLYQDIGGVYHLADESQSGLRMYNDLNEDAIDASASWSTFFTNWAGLPTMVKFGPQYIWRERDFSSRRFRYVPINTVGLDLTQTPEELFVPENIGPYFEFREETRSTDTYDAKQELVSVFGMVDLPLAPSWRLVGGVRVENFDQTVTTYDPFDLSLGGTGNPIEAQVKNTDVFPGVNLVWNYRGGQNFRIGFSQTVNRPEFRELAPFEFTDIVGGRAVVGNPDLERALIQNYDVRWEWFGGSAEVVSASFFFKNFDQPIERVVEPTAQLRTSYRNAESARNVGFELEARKQLGRNFVAAANYTFVDSEITLSPEDTVVLTSLTRPLAGTSTHLFNAFAEAFAGGTSVRVLLNAFSERIADVGSLGLPDILEEGRPTLDMVVTQRVQKFKIRFTAENLTNQTVRYVQADETQREYKYGRVFVISVGFSAF